MVAGDFNRDGNLDLATANLTSSSISILLGNATGGFGEARRIELPTRPQAIAAGDFNGDEILDLVTANPNANTVFIFAGDGNGNFSEPRAFPAGNAPKAVFVQDLDGDAILDLITINGPQDVLNSISILFGREDGSFYPPESQGFAERIYSVVAGNFNSDGSVELAVSTSAADGTLPKVVVLSLTIASTGMSGDGRSVKFERQQEIRLRGGPPVSITSGDFDGDGVLDLATANDVSSDVSILLGNGDGSFEVFATYPVGGGPRSITVGDFNHDDILDIATINSSNTVSVLIGDGDAGFTAPLRISTSDGELAYRPNAIAVGDFDSDGAPDLAIAASTPTDGYVGIFLAKDKAAFAPPTYYPIGPNPQAIAVADLDNDGRLDLAITTGGNPGNVYILLGDGRGGFAGAGMPIPVGNSPKAIVVGNFNPDSYLDLAVVNEGSNNISVLLGRGDGQFDTAGTFGIGAGGRAPQALVAGDFNNDRILDLAVTRDAMIGNGSIAILHGDGAGNFTLARTVPVGIGPIALAAADFNGDGHLDLAVVNSGEASDHLWILMGPDFSPSSVRRIAVGSDPGSVLAADVNNDKLIDLVVVNRRQNNVSLLLGNGRGDFNNSGPDFGTDRLPVSVAVADFNDDGVPDLAVACSDANRISVLLQNLPKSEPERSANPKETVGRSASESSPRSDTVSIPEGARRPLEVPTDTVIARNTPHEPTAQSGRQDPRTENAILVLDRSTSIGAPDLPGPEPVGSMFGLLDFVIPVDQGPDIEADPLPATATKPDR
jgi:hypothetical protein